MLFGFRRKKAGPPKGPPDCSFEALAMEHLDALYGTALRLTRDPGRAEDLVQDTLLRAYRFQDRFEPGTNMKAWLLRILTNNFINHYRREARERRLLDSEEGAPIGDGVMSRCAMRGLTESVSVAQEGLLREEILRALEELPDDYRLIIQLADVEELAYREIAEALDVPIGTVMSRLHRARKQLQKRLIAQAVSMGITSEPEIQEEAATVSLEAYRRKRKEAAG